ncbi:MAG: hypothetical protein HY794_18160 [Desulfarculus sp.]|nr:hypothetical protein [Desulfarculus sp.]
MDLLKPAAPAPPRPPSLSADVILTPGMRATRLCQTAPGELPTWAGHAGIVADDGQVYEALSIVRPTPWEEYPAPFEVWRYAHLTDVQRAAIGANRRAMAGTPYAPLKIGLHLVDWGLSWGLYLATLCQVKADLRIARRLALLRSLTICSQYVAAGYEEVMGYRFGGLPSGQVSPDDLHDHACATLGWYRVYKC